MEREEWREEGVRVVMVARPVEAGRAAGCWAQGTGTRANERRGRLGGAGEGSKSGAGGRGVQPPRGVPSEVSTPL